MTTLAELPTTDLILRVSGGPRDGELIPVGTPKCYLGMEPTNEAISKNPQCVIFRGREGAVIRSYADKVMFNDAAASLHWLRKGDTIKFPNAMKVEVVQLGELKDKANVKKSPEPVSVSNETIAPSENLGGQRLVVLESEIRSIQNQNEQSLTRFDQLDSRLNTLTEKMTMLINLSSNGSGVEVSQTSEAIAPPVSVAPATGFVESSAVSTELQSEEKIINPVDVVQSATETKSEVPAPATESVLSPAVPTPVELAPTEDQPVQEKVEEKVEEEVIQSPLSPSPLEELDRIDREIEQSVSGYYSHADDTDEQILTFDSDSASNDAPVPTSQAAVVEEPIAPAVSEALVSPTESVSAGTTPQDDVDASQAEAAAEAKAIADALAEKESRISEMERIFGGALNDSEPDEQEVAPQQPSPTEPTQSTPESLDPVSSNQAADEQLSQTFENPTHGLNAEVDSSADNSLLNQPVAQEQEQILGVSSEPNDLPETESATGDDLESRLSPMALQLLQDVKADQEKDPVVDAPESAEPQVSAVTPEAPAPAEEEVSHERQENESVSDLLARMKEDGKWDGVPAEGTPVEPVEPVQSIPEPEPMESEANVSDDEGDVEDYMSQLLSRMRGEEPAVEAKAVKEKKAKKKEVKKAVETPKFEAPADPLTSEEFKPKRKAEKLKSLDAMRELANSNARTNIKVSEVQNRKELAYVQAGIAVGGLLMSLYYFMFSSKALFDMSFVLGLVCLGAAGFCAYRFMSTMRQNASLVSTTVTPQEPTEQA